jgi:hypothetical protein
MSESSRSQPGFDECSLASADAEPSAAVQAERLKRELAREHEILPCNRRRAMRTRLTKARNFPVNTCPASRHVAIIADNLSTTGLDWMLLEEPLHCAGSMYATVAALWEARTEIARLRSLTEQRGPTDAQLGPGGEG